MTKLTLEETKNLLQKALKEKITIMKDLDLDRVVAKRVLGKRKKDITVDDIRLVATYTRYLRCGFTHRIPMKYLKRMAHKLPTLYQQGIERRRILPPSLKER